MTGKILEVDYQVGTNFKGHEFIKSYVLYARFQVFILYKHHYQNSLDYRPR
jgi:hypothetical protein